MRSIQFTLLSVIIILAGQLATAQTVQYFMPEETEPHEGTWIQWPHNHLYGPWYRDDVTPTFVAMADALQEGENVHIIAYDSSEQTYIINALTDAGVPLTNIQFYIYETDDVWSRDNGPMFVYDLDSNLTILDWGFNGWGNDTPYELCDVIPQDVGAETGLTVIDLNTMVLEGGAIEHDGHGTMMATRSSVTHASRNPNLTEAEIEDYLTTYMGITNFIWLDGVYGEEITDMHIDGFVKFADSNTIVTMDSTDLDYWLVTGNEITTIYGATNVDGDPFNIEVVPLTQNDVVTEFGTDLGFKGSYVNYYIGNDLVLVPTYNDPSDQVAINIIQGLYANRTVVGVDVRNLYEYGGMIHCITQQQPVELITTGIHPTESVSTTLSQNFPNPANGLTTFNYSIENNERAILDIYNATGKLISSQALNGSGTLTFDSGELSAGVYFYNLNVDGQRSDGRWMVVAE